MAQVQHKRSTEAVASSGKVHLHPLRKRLLRLQRLVTQTMRTSQKSIMVLISTFSEV